MDYYKLDEKDIVILENLSKDSRIRLSTLAEMLNTSIPTIRSRIDKLEALGIIQQFSIALSYELLSEHPSYFILIKTSPNVIENVITILYELNETTISFPENVFRPISCRFPIHLSVRVRLPCI